MKTKIDIDQEPRAKSQKIVLKKSRKPKNNNERNFSIWFTLLIIIIGGFIVLYFKETVNAFGVSLMTRYGVEWVDTILFIITAISSTPFFLPVWGYVMAGVAMGYNIYHLAAVMAVASAVGSTATLYMGQYFSHKKIVKKYFPNIHEHPWTHGKSRFVVTIILFFGTVSPIPIDIFYAACGAKKYPLIPFLIVNTSARFIKYLYIALGFDFLSSLF